MAEASLNLCFFLLFRGTDERDKKQNNKAKTNGCVRACDARESVLPSSLEQQRCRACVLRTSLGTKAFLAPPVCARGLMKAPRRRCRSAKRTSLCSTCALPLKTFLSFFNNTTRSSSLRLSRRDETSATNCHVMSTGTDEYRYTSTPRNHHGDTRIKRKR